MVGGKSIAEAIKQNYTLETIELMGNDIPEEYMVAITAVTNRNKENATFRERETEKSRYLEMEVLRLRSEHEDYVDRISSQMKRTVDESRVSIRM